MARRRSGGDGQPVVSGLWRRQVHSCSQAVTRFHGIVAATPEGPAREWLAGIGNQLDQDLDAVRRLAVLGTTIEPGAWLRARQPPARRVAERLAQAVEAFRAVESRAADIAVQLALDPSYDHVRGQLDILEQQVPYLARALPPEPDPPAPRKRRWRRS
jgi:hypothetical protein